MNIHRHADSHVWKPHGDGEVNTPPYNQCEYVIEPFCRKRFERTPLINDYGATKAYTYSGYTYVMAINITKVALQPSQLEIVIRGYY